MHNVTKPLIAIVVPVFNERDNLRPFYEEVTAVIRSMRDYDWEIVFVDDGSRDGSFEVVGALRAHDERVLAVRFPRNFGSHIAIAAGIDFCHGDAAIVMAADRQDPPALIREFVDRWRDGHDVVWGARTGRDDGALRSRAMGLFYRLVRRFAIPTYPSGGTGSFCLISRPVIEAFRQCTEHNRLTFGLIAWSGFRETSVPYHRPRRLIGSSSWTVRRMMRAAIDTFVSFSSLPIRVISLLGLLVSLLSFVFGFYVLINKLVFGTQVQGWTSVMLAVLVVGGMQLLMIGVLGEYLQRILDEARARPLYIVERTLGFAPTGASRPDRAIGAWSQLSSLKSQRSGVPPV
jgi:polyisoprenyl-phosphate glycosyltransferase